MTAHLQESRQGAEECSRKRKPHKKSRRGCRNCKLRRVKCDEFRPECKKCIDYGVTCNYDTKTPDLQMSLGSGAPKVIDNLAQKIEVKKKAPRFANSAQFTNPAIFGQGVLELSAIRAPSFASESILLDKDSLGLLDRFRHRTIGTLGTTRTAPIYKDVSIREAFAHPYLMHIVLTLTSIHDRFLSPVPDRKPTVTELHHWTEGASLLNKKLSSPWPPEARDSLWTAAALLGAIAFSNVEAAGPEEAWPLKEADSSDLEWLRMSDGKQIIWKICDPLRPESAFYALAVELVNDQMYVDTSCFNYEDVPHTFLSLFEIDEFSTPENNPYFSTIRILSSLLHMECDHSTIAKYLSFMSGISKDYKKLLEQKDPRALLLLAYWFGKVSHGVWWVSQRALMEGQAACLYLEKYHSHETAIMDLLDFPKRELGLIV